MSASTLAAPSIDAITADTNPSKSQRVKAVNKIEDDVIRQALGSIAELRRYILISHPSLLKQASPCLIQAESEIFSIMGQLSH